MKIRYWEKDGLGKYGMILALLTCYPLLNYFSGRDIDWPIIYLGILLLLLCFFLDFLPNYFNYIVRLENNSLIIKNGILRKPVSIDINTIKSIYISEIGFEKIFMTIERLDGETTPWNTRLRTKEIYDQLIKLYPHWKKVESN